MGIPHTFTTTFFVDDGTGTDADGVMGNFDAAANADITVSLTDQGSALSVPQGPLAGTTDSNGQFDVTFTSQTPGTTIGSAEGSLVVNGVTLTRTTDGSETLPGSGVFNSDEAIKEWALTLGEADIQLSATESADPVVAGSGPGNLVYQVTATNAGPSDASGLTFSQALSIPAGVSVDSITPSRGTFAGGVWTVGTLSSGSSVTLTVVLAVDSSAAERSNAISNTVTVTGLNELDMFSSNDSVGQTTSVMRAVDVQVSTTESVDPVAIDAVPAALTYQVQATNADLPMAPAWFSVRYSRYRPASLSIRSLPAKVAFPIRPGRSVT